MSAIAERSTGASEQAVVAARQRASSTPIGVSMTFSTISTVAGLSMVLSTVCRLRTAKSMARYRTQPCCPDHRATQGHQSIAPTGAQGRAMRRVITAARSGSARLSLCRKSTPSTSHLFCGSHSGLHVMFHVKHHVVKRTGRTSRGGFRRGVGGAVGVLNLNICSLVSAGAPKQGSGLPSHPGRTSSVGRLLPPGGQHPRPSESTRHRCSEGVDAERFTRRRSTYGLRGTSIPPQ